MSFDVPELASKLRILSWGRGIENAGLESRTGPALRWMAGVRGVDGFALTQRMVGDNQRTLVGFLPADVRLVMFAALGLRNEGRMSICGHRVTVVARKLDRAVQRQSRRRHHRHRQTCPKPAGSADA